jgi:hypothetical protein
MTASFRRWLPIALVLTASLAGPGWAGQGFHRTLSLQGINFEV